mmetsp:Transcript_129748/g.361454  ORF Transcript_129748/g.361454 Transcript_129748/m.361454 type:complete len:81 (+) Transcript_129748:19-261(+)
MVATTLVTVMALLELKTGLSVAREEQRLDATRTQMAEGWSALLMRLSMLPRSARVMRILAQISSMPASEVSITVHWGFLL